MIEIDNLEEIAADLNQATIRDEIEGFRARSAQHPGQMNEEFLQSKGQHSVRALLELLLEEADKTENIVVIRFSTKDSDAKCERVKGETMMILNSTESAIRATQLLHEAASKLGQQVLAEILNLDNPKH